MTTARSARKIAEQHLVPSSPTGVRRSGCVVDGCL